MSFSPLSIVMGVFSLRDRGQLLILESWEISWSSVAFLIFPNVEAFSHER